jgi:hypothetical protein
LFSVIFNLFPLGIPGQWIYPYNNKGIFSFMHLVYGGIIFALIAGFVVHFCSRRQIGKRNKIIVFSLIILAGFFFDLQVLKSGRMGMGENLLAIYDPFATGYYQKALTIDSTGGFLAGFTTNQRYRGFINHSDVHPPGRTLFSYYIYTIVKNSPQLTAFLIKNMPYDMSDMYQQVKQNNLLPQFNLTDDVKAAAILHIYLFLLILSLGKLFFALAVWKAYGFDCALENSVLYLFVPTTILFLGHYDGLLATFTSFVILFVVWKPPEKYLIPVNIVLGVCCSIFILQSIAVAVPCLWLVFFWLLRKSEYRENDNFRFVVTHYFIPYGIGILIFIIFMWLCYNFILPAVLFSCLRNNELFFQHQSTRSIIWKVLNPVEFLIGTGISTFFLLIIFAYDYIKSANRKIEMKLFQFSKQHALELASLLCLVLLLITPTRAEVARQWSLACPFVYVLVIKATRYYQFKFYHLVILGGLLAAQIFIFRFFLEIVLMHY